MKSNTRLLPNLLAAAVVALLLCSCIGKKTENESAQPARLATPEKKQRTVIEPSLLPQRFQKAGYMINDEEANALLDSEASDEFELKVGADITTHEPITLRDAMKALVRNKKMGLSWASDVDQDLLVDVDVTAEDNFHEAIDNILRQLDYFHETQGSTLIIKYRETKQYQIAMPFVKHNYETGVGGDLFGNNDAMKSTKGYIQLDSEENQFDIWENIQKNLDILIATWGATTTTPTVEEKKESDVEQDMEVAAQASRRESSTESSYTIDKPVGLITVHAPRPLQKRISDYLQILEKELYKQIIIEAKIIEVQLENNSSLGINWNTIIESLTFTGGTFGAGKIYDKYNQGEYGSVDSDSTTVTRDNTTTISSEDSSEDIGGTTPSTTTTDAAGTVTTDIVNTLSEAVQGTSGVLATIIGNSAYNGAYGAVSLGAFSIANFINALKQQGKTSILSNPKISVMNGQPALITVGRNVTYIESIEAKIDQETNTTNYTINTERVLSGVGLALSAVVKRDNDIVMNLVPVTSELAEDIEYREIAGSEIGLPIVNIREMSTTVTVKNDSILVLGGLISETEINEGDHLYGTENIPYLKYLFGYEKKQKVKRELIILLRPRII